MCLILVLLSIAVCCSWLWCCWRLRGYDIHVHIRSPASLVSIISISCPSCLSPALPSTIASVLVLSAPTRPAAAAPGLVLSTSPSCRSVLNFVGCRPLSTPLVLPTTCNWAKFLENLSAEVCDQLSLKSVYLAPLANQRLGFVKQRLLTKYT